MPIDGSPLATVGGAAVVRTSLGNYLLARTGQDTFTALTAVCTHEANQITNFTGSQFACTFHGSLYTTSGSVARGPATRPLTSYPTTFAGNTVTFTRVSAYGYGSGLRPTGLTAELRSGTAQAGSSLEL